MEELTSLRKTLSRLETLLYGLNYECHFRLEPIVDSTQITPSPMPATMWSAKSGAVA